MRPLRAMPKMRLRAVARQVDEAFQRQPAGIDVVEHDRHQRLHAGHARRRGRIGLCLLLQRMRRVVGAEHVDDALRDAAPDAVAMPCRRAPAGSSATACRAAHSRRPTASGDAASPRRSRHPCALRGTAISSAVEMCSTWMRARASRAMPHQPLGAAQCRDLVAPDRMRRRVAGDAFAKPFAQAEFVLGMEGGAAARVPQDRGDAFIVLDQQVAGRRAHEHLDAGRARQPFELADVAGVLARAADPEGEVAMHAARARGCTLSASAASLVVSGLVLGISKTAVTPPSTAAREPRFEVFLVLQPGLAEMHLAVDDARQDMQPAAVDRLTGRCRERSPMAAIRPPLTPMSRRPCAVMVDDRAACQDEVVGRRHAVLPLLPAWMPAAYVMASVFASSGFLATHADSPSRRPRDRLRLRSGRGEFFAEHRHRRSRRAASGEARPSALLTPQGKILFDFLVSRAGENACSWSAAPTSPTISCAG